MNVRHINLQKAHMQQRGAALVVGLILLVVLSLMAVATMNTATLDLIMAGNEQYRNRAFTASEAGIEVAFHTEMDSSQDIGPVTGTLDSSTTKYTYTITRPNGGATDPPPPGTSSGTFGTIYFQINSTGESERSTKTAHTQQLYQVIKWAEDTTCAASVGGCALGGE